MSYESPLSTIVKFKQKEHDDLEKEISEFEANGGKVQRLGPTLLSDCRKIQIADINPYSRKDPTR